MHPGPGPGGEALEDVGGVEDAEGVVEPLLALGTKHVRHVEEQPGPGATGERGHDHQNRLPRSS